MEGSRGGGDGLLRGASFARSLGGRIAVFRDVLTAYALELRKGQAITSRQFEVTPRMLAQVQRRLRERGVTVEDSVFVGAARIVEEQLGFEIARYTFGPAAERHRRATGDRQIQQAIEVARGTTSPRALVGLAAPTPPQVH